MPERLRAELAGILAWAVKGCLEWQRRGLATPEQVKTATDEYRFETDRIKRCINELCARREGYKVRARGLYLAYRKWAEETGEVELSETAFGRRMKDLGFAKTRGRDGIVYLGIGLRAAVQGHAAV